MSKLKKFGAVAAVGLALAGVGGSSASAAQFTASSATGSLSGRAITTQVFTFSGGQVKCLTAKTTGTLSALSSPEQHLTVALFSCNYFGFASGEITPMTYLYTASGQVHLLSPVTISVPAAGCKVTIAAQTLPIAFDNNGSKLITTSNATGIKYTTTGFLCGASGENGTFVGNSEIERVGGGSYNVDP